jgi:murein DD-endopeptidase MepM/ murein hydrolase activator NlpD
MDRRRKSRVGQKLGRRKCNKKMNSLLKKSITITLGFVLIGLLAITFLNKWSGNFSAEAADDFSEEEPFIEPVYEFGLPIDSFFIVKDKIKPNQFLADILLKYKIPYSTIDKIVKSSKGIFDVRTIAVGKEYTVFCTNDSINRACYFVYQPSLTEYIVFDFGDSLNVYKEQKEVILEEREVAGEVTSSLYASMTKQGVSPKLAVELSEIYAWTIDFYRIQKGDHFKVIYDVKIVDGEVVGIGQIKAANFNHFGNDYYAYYFEQAGQGEYYDENGMSLRKAFLKAPLKFSKITSGYSLNRLHPVQKTNKPHYGTDYAAPTGTPIMTVGDGVVVEAQFKQHNGNYVKIRHNSTYTTQYLHMSKIAVKKGQYVRQGQTIGYVGSTGLATGPHVCFRFWKNDKQVDHLKEKFPSAEPVKKEYKTLFEENKLIFESRLKEKLTT